MSQPPKIPIGTCPVAIDRRNGAVTTRYLSFRAWIALRAGDEFLYQDTDPGSWFAARKTGVLRAAE